MNKKILLGSSMIAIATPIVATISCGMNFGPQFRRKGGEIYLVTDTGSVRDKSFNQFVFEGVRKFAKKANKTYSYIQPSVSTTQNLQNAYNYVAEQGAKVTVLPAYTHGFFGNGKIGKLNVDDKDGFESNHPNMHYVGIDFPDGDPNNRVYSLMYKSEESAFLSAVYAGIYMNTKKLVEGKTLKMAGFGGIDIPSVTDFLNGYYAGAMFFNKIVFGNTKPPFNSPKLGFSNAWKPIEIIFSGDRKHGKEDFTRSFNIGDGTAHSQSFIRDGAQVIIAVSGGQTGDLVGAIKEARKIGKVYAIGVDVDQSLSFDSRALIGCAAKGIGVSTTYTLQKIYKNGINKLYENGDRLWTYNDPEGRDGDDAIHAVRFIKSINTPENVHNNIISNKVYSEALKIVKADADANNNVNDSRNIKKQIDLWPKFSVSYGKGR